MKRIVYARAADPRGALEALKRQREVAESRARSAGYEIDERIEEVHGGLALAPMLERLILRAEDGETIEIHVAGIDRVSRDPRVVREVLARLGAAGVGLVTEAPDGLQVLGIAMLCSHVESRSQTISRALRARREARG